VGTKWKAEGLEIDVEEYQKSVSVMCAQGSEHLLRRKGVRNA